MNEPSEFCCPFCNSWQPIVSFTQHLKLHVNGGTLSILGSHDIINPPETYEDFQRRFGPIGLLEER